MMVTRNERLRSGLYSDVSVIVMGMAPPRPRPVMKRQIASVSTFVAQAEAMLARLKPTVAKTRTGFTTDPVGHWAEHEGAHHQAGQTRHEQQRELRRR